MIGYYSLTDPGWNERLSRHWYKVAGAVIRTRDIALYRTANTDPSASSDLAGKLVYGCPL